MRPEFQRSPGEAPLVLLSDFEVARESTIFVFFSTCATTVSVAPCLVELHLDLSKPQLLTTIFHNSLPIFLSILVSLILNLFFVVHQQRWIYQSSLGVGFHPIVA